MKYEEISPYRLVQRLGGGGFGDVWLARDGVSGSQVALKFLERAPEEGRLEEFKKEFKTLSRLHHPHLVSVHHFGSTDGGRRYFFATEYFPGRGFFEAMSGKPLSYVEEAFVQILSALDYIHSEGIIHFDIKSENVLVAEEGHSPTIKLVDFGIASPRLLDPGRAKGTLAFMAPEFFLKSSVIDHRADLYSLGILCFRALTGIWPFYLDNSGDVSHWHLHGELPDDAMDRAGLPSYWREILGGLLRKKPSERFASARVALNFLNLATGHRYRLIEQGLKGLMQSDGPLVGRQEVLGEVLSLFQKSVVKKEAFSQAPIATLIGERGIGKSRLLAEIRHEVELAEIPLYEISCDWKVSSWNQILERLNFVPMQSREELAANGGERGRLHPALPVEGATLAPVINAPTQARAAVDLFLEKASTHPFCLFVDDFDKADEETRHFLHFLRERAEWMLKEGGLVPFFVVITAGEETGLGPSFALTRLTDPQIRRYVTLVMGESEENDGITSLLRSYSGGLPLLLVEGIRYLVSEVGKGRPLSEITIPATLLSLYSEKIATLEAPPIRLLHVAALVFRPLPVDWLRRLGALDDDLFATALNSSLAAGLLEKIGDAKGRVTIRVSSQALALEVIGSLGEEEKKNLHHEIAEGLNRLGGVPREEVAYHWEKAERRLEAMSGFREAAREAERKGLTGLAGTFFRKAFELGDRESRREVGCDAVRVLILSGLFDEAEKIVAALEPISTSQEYTLKGWLLYKERRFAEARVAYEKALQEAGPGEKIEKILLTNDLGNVALHSGETVHAVELFSSSLEAEEGLRPAERMRVQNNNLGLALAVLGRTDEALSFCDSRLSQVPDTMVPEKISALNAKGYVLIRASRFHEAAAILRDAFDLVESSRAHHNLFSVLGNLIIATLRESRYAEAIPLLQKMVSFQQRFGTKRDAAFNTLRQASLYLTLGIPETSSDLIRRGLEMADSVGDRNLAAWFRLMEGYWEKEFGSSQTSRDLFRALTEGGSSREAPEVAAWARYATAEIFFDDGEPERAQQELGGITGEIADEEMKLRIDLLGLRIRVGERRVSAGDPVFADLQERVERGQFREILSEVYDTWGMGAWLEGNGERAEQLKKIARDIVDSIAALLPQEYQTRYLNLKSRRRIFEPFKEVTVMPNETVLTQLMKISKRMLSERDPQKLLEFVMDTAIELSGAEEGLLLLLNAAGEFEPRVARNVKQENVDAVRFSRTVADEVARTGRAMLTTDVVRDDRFQASLSVTNLDLKSIVCLPLRLHNKTIGVLYLATRQKTAPFQKDFVAALEDFADQAALAFQNATLLEEKMAANRRLEADLTKTRDDLQTTEAHVRELEALVSKKRRRTLFAYDKIIGGSKKMEEVLGILDKITNAIVPVFIHGETGTGKELVARAIHQNSTRRDKPFMAINCSAFTETILESELFGYLKGAFTGADRDRKGLFEEASGGVVFLDEVGDMSLSMQAKVLRVIQEQEVLRLGSRGPTKIDVRIVSASNKDLAKLVHEGKFREDLYYRIAGMTVKLPPLRQRREDVPLLVKHFIEKIRKENRISRPIRVGKVSLQKLMAYDWPGNIRELEQCLTNAALLSESEEIRPEDFLVKNRAAPAEESVARVPPVAEETFHFSPEKKLDDYEREIIEKVLSFCAGNKSEAARRLGLSRLTLYKKLEEYKL